MSVGALLKAQASRSSDRTARAQEAGWSLVLSAPGLLGGFIREWWFTAKRVDGGKPSESDLEALRAIVTDAGGDGQKLPEEAIQGTLMWRWPAAPGEPIPRPAARAKAADVGRNDPCPCGSGKKFKKCCLDKIPKASPTGLGAGPCDGPNQMMNGPCNAPGVEEFYCKLCDKRYSFCGTHEEAVRTMMNGHISRVHPEEMPKEFWDAVLASPAYLDGVRKQREIAPHLWEKFFAHIEKLQGGAN